MAKEKTAKDFGLKLNGMECLVLGGTSFTSKDKFNEDGTAREYYLVRYYSGRTTRTASGDTLVAFQKFVNKDMFDYFAEYGSGIYNLLFDGSGNLQQAEFVEPIFDSTR